MYTRLSDKKVTHMKKAFNEELDQLASKALSKNTSNTQQLHQALKELTIECRRKNIKVTADELSPLALGDINTIKRHIIKAHKTMHTKNFGAKYYTDLTELPSELKEQFKQAAIKRTEFQESINFFNEKERVYFKFPPKIKLETKTEKEIKKYILTQGYETLNYNEGLAIKIRKKEKRNIGRLLKEHPQLAGKFRDDPTRSIKYSKFKDLRIVISRKPEDLQRMSISRAWKACTAETLFHSSCTKYITKDIKKGTIVAYLTSAKYPEILNPLSRILFKPYKSIETEQTIFVPFKTYGINNQIFTNTVSEIINAEINDPKAKGVFEIDSNIMADRNYHLFFIGSGVYTDTFGNEYIYKENNTHTVSKPCGDKEWYTNRKLNNENAPALTRKSGYEAYYKDGKQHNENSHAVKYPNGQKEYFLHDKKLTEEAFNEWRAEQNSLNKKQELSLKIS